MSDLYYVTKIRGCIALKDIKKGTLIVSESPKLIAKGNPWSLDPTCKGQIMSKCIYEIICQVSQPWDIRSDRDFYVRLPLRSESKVFSH